MSVQASATNVLIDPLGRRIDYVRLSVTDKCNLRCFYCLPKGYSDFGKREAYLTFDETERVIGAFADLGVQRVRITGGEPLVRKDLSGLASRFSPLRPRRSRPAPNWLTTTSTTSCTRAALPGCRKASCIPTT